MGIMDLVNKIIGGVQSATNTVQNAKYTYDQAKNTVSSIKQNENNTEAQVKGEATQPSSDVNQKL